MPTITIRPENGFLNLGILRVPTDALEALEVTSPNDAAQGGNQGKGAIKVAEARVQALLDVVQHDKKAQYTIALTITREPVTEAEATAIAVKLGQQQNTREQKKREEAQRVQERIRIVQDAERAAADRQAEIAQSVLTNTIQVLSRGK